ncbi:MAG TPA: class I SAM-dependent methyltransferase [Terriglobales bacterium]|nr:class I SAM-dependent methyltransferase [Terriglobales bacterium]
MASKTVETERMPATAGIERFEALALMLRCLRCKAELSLEDQGFHCQNCAARFPITNGVVRFVESQGYAENFGFEWTKYARTQLDDEISNLSERQFLESTGFNPQDLHGKWVLDIGCGMGRFAEVASRWGAKVVGIDLSLAADVAAKNLSARQNVWICQASVLNLPFHEQSFDYIYSIGVLHHTPDCEQSFKQLPRLLKPGGSVAIWLYSGYTRWYRMADVYRRFTTKMSPRKLHALCVAADSLYYVHRGLQRVPVVGSFLSGALNYMVPINMNPSREWRLLDTFDWYSPVYQSKHTYEQVFRWFEDCGLEDLRVLHRPIAVRGTKPTRHRDQPA